MYRTVSRRLKHLFADINLARFLGNYNLRPWHFFFFSWSPETFFIFPQADKPSRFRQNNFIRFLRTARKWPQLSFDYSEKSMQREKYRSGCIFSPEHLYLHKCICWGKRGRCPCELHRSGWFVSRYPLRAFSVPLRPLFLLQHRPGCGKTCCTTICSTFCQIKSFWTRRQLVNFIKHPMLWDSR